jgi:hypothetical protein
MGILGGIVVLVPIAAILTTVPRALWIARARPDLRALSDFYVGSVSCIMVTFLFEGYLFGVLTFVVMFIYIILSLGQFLDHAYRAERSSIDEEAASESQGLPAL